MDVEKTIQFLLDQAARSDARLNAHIAQFEQETTRINNTLGAIAVAQAKTSALLDRLAERTVQLEESHRQGMAELRDAGAATDERLRALAEEHRLGMAKLREAGEATDERLRALAMLVERHIATHR